MKTEIDEKFEAWFKERFKGCAGGMLEIIKGEFREPYAAGFEARDEEIILETCDQGKLNKTLLLIQNKQCEQITLLKSVIAKQAETLEFYANSKNWQTPEAQGFKAPDLLSEEFDDMIDDDNDDTCAGGKRARATKAEVGKMMGTKEGI